MSKTPDKLTKLANEWTRWTLEFWEWKLHKLDQSNLNRPKQIRRIDLLDDCERRELREDLRTVANLYAAQTQSNVGQFLETIASNMTVLQVPDEGAH